MHHRRVVYVRDPESPTARGCFTAIGCVLGVAIAILALTAAAALLGIATAP